MKILVWGINYSPEVSGIAPFNTALCEYLVGRGHRVTMLTTFPYYPQWKSRPEDSGKFAETETINGVEVARVWHYIPKKLSTINRIIHEASFLVLSFLRVLQMDKFDIAVVVSPVGPRLFRVALFQDQGNALRLPRPGSATQRRRLARHARAQAASPRRSTNSRPSPMPRPPASAESAAA